MREISGSSEENGFHYRVAKVARGVRVVCILQFFQLVSESFFLAEFGF
jgi:hypothetical protein